MPSKVSPIVKAPTTKFSTIHIQNRGESTQSFLTIGKPAVSHHYKPKTKPKQKEA